MLAKAGLIDPFQRFGLAIRIGVPSVCLSDHVPSLDRGEPGHEESGGDNKFLHGRSPRSGVGVGGGLFDRRVEHLGHGVLQHQFDVDQVVRGRSIFMVGLRGSVIAFQSVKLWARTEVSGVGDGVVVRGEPV